MDTQGQKEKTLGETIPLNESPVGTCGVADCNTLIREVEDVMVSKPDISYNVLCIHGAAPIDETSLRILKIVIDTVLSRKQNLSIKFVSHEEFNNENLAASRDNQLSSFHQKYGRINDMMMVETDPSLLSRMKGLHAGFAELSFPEGAADENNK